MIYKFYPGVDEKWEPIRIESELPIEGISRIVVQPGWLQTCSCSSRSALINNI